MDVTASAIRKLVERGTNAAPVTSVYLNTDGSRYPRANDYEARLDGLLRDVVKAADRLDGSKRDAVHADAEAISRWVRNEFTRRDVRGLALFASKGEIFETLQVAEGVRNTARVNDSPYVVPLEVLVGRHHHLALVVIQRDKARIFRYRLGRVEEYLGLVSDVHRQHEQGGWSQARFGRNIDNEVLHHKKEAAELLRKAHEQEPFDAVVVAGPRTEALEFIEQVHPYVRERVQGEPIALELNATTDEIRERLSEVEQALVSARRSHLLQRLMAGHGTAEKSAFGIRHVLEAANRKAIEVLFVVEGAGEPGYRSQAGALALHREEAESFGGPVAPVEDLIDEIIEDAVRGGAHIELFRDAVRLDGHPVAALLRF